VAKKAKPGTGLAAAQKYLGLTQNAQGKFVRPGAGLATKVIQNKLGQYVPTDPGFGTVSTSNKRGELMGSFTGGQFTLAGGKGRPAARKTRGVTKGGIAPSSITSDLAGLAPFAEADIAQTSLLGAQGKAYAAGRQGASGTLLGATSKPTMPGEEPGAKGRHKRRGKGKAKGRKARTRKLA
jgi:hypothetical protein